MKRLSVSRKLAGEYSATIAAHCETENPARNKRLRYVLYIYADNGWSVEFHVTIAGVSVAFDSLASAVRAYDKESFGGKP